MTYAPACIKAARNYLMSRGVPGASLGIVGDPDHKSSGGYHCGNDWLSDIGRLYTDYSKRQSYRDRPGTDAAMALDIGGLSDAALWALNQWIVSQCVAGAPWTADIREVIYWHAPTNTIRRWDRLGITTGGGWSHRTHTHISYHRDSEGRDKTEMFRRYYEPWLFVVPESAPATTEEDEDYMYMVEANGANGVGAYAIVTSDGKCIVRLKSTLTGGADTANLWSRICRHAADNVTAKAWNDTMDLFGVVGYRFDANANLQTSA